MREATDDATRARIEIATAAYCDAWCSEYEEIGQEVPASMRLRSGPAYEATKRCMIEALMAADRVAARHAMNRWAPTHVTKLVFGVGFLAVAIVGALGWLS